MDVGKQIRDIDYLILEDFGDPGVSVLPSNPVRYVQEF